MNCPSCGASVPAGETICLDCGTELVFAFDAPEPSPSPVPAPTPAAPAAPAAREQSCPDCGERVARDANGLCPVCGHDFGGPVEIDEDEFFKDPPSLDQAMAAERERLQRLGQSASTAPSSAPSSAPLPGDPDPGALPPLPGDRHRSRYQGTGAQAAVPRDVAFLVIDGGQTVFFDGRMTSQVRLDVDQVLVGRRDPAQGHYPDIDLGHFRHIDGHISRRHARVYRQQGRWYLEDLCENDATYLNDKAHALNGETVALNAGDRILISDSVAMTLTIQRTS